MAGFSTTKSKPVAFHDTPPTPAARPLWAVLFFGGVFIVRPGWRVLWGALGALVLRYLGEFFHAVNCHALAVIVQGAEVLQKLLFLCGFAVRIDFFK